MIVSHKHRFIFIKTAKTAGTSIEFALATLCGPDDIITPVSRKEEERRGDAGARNWEIAEKDRPWTYPIARLFGRHPKWSGAQFYNHMGATRVKALIGGKIWNSYYKVAVERNPWDREVSNYFFRTRRDHPKPEFRDWVLDPAQHHLLKNFHAYSIDGKVAVDKIIRYENLKTEFADFVHKLGVEEVPELPWQKSGLRPSGVPYRSYYDDATRARVAELYEREIKLLGYEF
jgi:hypothetical protein